MGFFFIFSRALKTQGWKAASEQHLPDIWYYLETASDKWTLSLKSCEEFYYSTLKIFWGKGGCKLLTMWSSFQVGTENGLMYWGSHVVHRKKQRISSVVASQLKISSCNCEKHIYFCVVTAKKRHIHLKSGLSLNTALFDFLPLSSCSTGCLYRVNLGP